MSPRVGKCQKAVFTLCRVVGFAQEFILEEGVDIFEGGVVQCLGSCSYGPSEAKKRFLAGLQIGRYQIFFSMWLACTGVHAGWGTV